MFHISQEEQRLVTLAECTFQSQRTEEIHLATKQFKSFMVLKYPNSFSQLEELITKKNLLPLNTRKALINLYKASSEWILQILETQAILNNQSLSSHKRLLYTIEHAFDNSKIESEIKHPIELTYIDVFVFFNAENHERLIAKSKYYFNIKEELLALSLLEMYHNSKSPFKHKVEYYPTCLLTLCNYLEKKLDKLYAINQEQELGNTFQTNLSRHMAVLHEIWTSLNFEMHQSTFIGIFNQDNFVKIWQQLCGNRFPHHLFHYVLDIAEHVIWSLIRCNLIGRYQTLVQLFRQLGLRELHSLMETDQLNENLTGEEEKYRISQLKYLITCFDGSFREPLLQMHVTIFDIFSRLIYPNFKLIKTYLDKHSNNLDQIDSFLEDLTFGMRSECIEVLTHKLTISLCKNSEDMLIGVRVIISTFLFKHLPMISRGEIQDMAIPYILQTSIDLLVAGKDFWTTINSQIPQKDQILWMLLFTAIGADLFMTDMQFLSDLNRFMGANSDFLWKKDPEITFYSLLIYKNYKDDIFSDNKTSGFKMNLINCALQDSDRSLIRQFSITILKEQFDSKPPYDTVFLTVQHIFHSMVRQFISDLLPLIHIIFKHYKSQIAKLKSTIPLFGTIYRLFEQSIRSGRSSIHTQKYFAILELFLEIPQCSPHFSSLILNTVTLAQSLHPKSCEFAQQFLSLLTKGLIILGSLPPTAEQILSHFNIQFHSIQIVNNFTYLIRYTKNISFINWLLKELIRRQFNIESCLLLHSLIYYQGDNAAVQILDQLIQKIYRYRVEHRVGVNYVTGKVNLVLLLLIRKNRSRVHWIMHQEKWTNLQVSIHQELKVQFQFNSKQTNGNRPVPRQDSDQTFLSHNHHNLPFIDAIYNLLYVDEHVYCWKYDIEVFLVNQIQLLLTELQEEWQLRYANVSMVAILKNIIRAQQFIFNLQEEGEESQDEQIFEGKQFDRESMVHQDTCNQYNRPEEFKQDYLFLFKQLIQRLKSTQSSHTWLTTIVQSIFNREEKHNLQEVLNSSFCGGNKIRSILRVRGVLVDKDPYMADSII